MIKSIYSTHGDSSDYSAYVKNSHATDGREASVFDVYSDSDESHSNDNLDLIIDALTQLQARSCSGRVPAELPDRLRVIASIDDPPYQHGTTLTPVREIGSVGTPCLHGNTQQS